MSLFSVRQTAGLWAQLYLTASSHTPEGCVNYWEFSPVRPGRQWCHQKCPALTLSGCICYLRHMNTKEIKPELSKNLSHQVELQLCGCSTWGALPKPTLESANRYNIQGHFLCWVRSSQLVFLYFMYFWASWSGSFCQQREWLTGSAGVHFCCKHPNTVLKSVPI